MGKDGEEEKDYIKSIGNGVGRSGIQFCTLEMWNLTRGTITSAAEYINTEAKVSTRFYGNMWEWHSQTFPEEMTNATQRKKADMIRQASGSGVVIKQQENVAMDRIMGDFQT